EVRVEGVDRLVGEPAAGLVVRLLAGQHLLPVDALLALIRLVDGGVEDALGRPPDVGPGPVSLDEGERGVVGDGQVSLAVAGDEAHAAEVRARAAATTFLRSITRVIGPTPPMWGVIQLAR